MTQDRIGLLVGIAAAVLAPIIMWFLPDRSCPRDMLCGTFIPVGGHAYVYNTIFAFSKPDTVQGMVSDLKLYEDGKPLGPPHSDVQTIIDSGSGRFIYWQSSMKIGLFMSASDNSDPNTNGRKYTVKDADAEAVDRSHVKASGKK